MNLNESDFRTLLDSTHDFVVATFSATWCGPCRIFAPIFQSAEQNWNGKNPKLAFAKLDVEESAQLCEDLGISAVPTIILFKDSKVIARKEGGFPTESHFVDWLNRQGVKGK